MDGTVSEVWVKAPLEHEPPSISSHTPVIKAEINHRVFIAFTLGLLPPAWAIDPVQPRRDGIT